MDPKTGFAIYIFGTLLVAGGVTWALVTMGLPPVWIAIVGMVVLGFGIRGAVKKLQTEQ